MKMMLILFLSLIAKLTSVSIACDIGPKEVKNFDYHKYTGVWYWLLHTPNALDDDFECPITQYAHSDGRTTQVTAETFLTSQQRHVRRVGKLLNIESNGHWEEEYGDPYFVHVPIDIIAVDYDRFSIVKYCMFQHTKSYTFVLYRNMYPDQATVKAMEKKLKENGIDVNELVEYRMENCKFGNWKAGEVP